MRDFLRILAVGIVMFFVPQVNAEQYKVLVVPDNIVTENAALDSYIYNASAEFFANEIINILNGTDYIKSPTVSEERKFLKSNPSNMISARNLTERFKTSYNLDYTQLAKIASRSGSRYVLMLTSSIDAENYIMRRTLWDFLNIPGAAVVDPAYKISTYAVLVDTKNNRVLWSNTFYKTISVVENRIITRGGSPQTEQMQKIRDYSRMLCPEIAQNVQLKVLPADVYGKETNKIYYDIGNFDNVFTKKYRRWHKEGTKVYNVAKTEVDAKLETAKQNVKENVENTKQKIETKKKEHKEKTEKKREEKLQKMNTRDAQTLNQQGAQNSRVQNNGIHNINFIKKQPEIKTEPDYGVYDLDLRKPRKNNLYGEFDTSRPPLRDYN